MGIASLSEWLGTELSIIQAPMAGVQGSALAIAAANAGALGSLPCALIGADAIRDELIAMRANTNGVYNVNFFCHMPPVVRPEREAAWRKTLAPYYAELGVDKAAIPSGPTRAPLTHDVVDVIEPFRPPIVSFHFGLPSDELIARVRAWGAKIIASATTVDEARWLEARGVDAIVAQGLEAGGHRGMFLSPDLTMQMGTFALVPQVVHAVRVPVIAAGGIADADGVAAALRLGAAGVQIGTAFLLCPEATTTKVHRAALASDAARHTALTTLFSGGPARGVVNRLMRELGPLNEMAPPFPLASAAIAPLRAAAEAKGSGDFSPLWSGQNASQCKALPAAEITRQLAVGLP